MKLKIVEDVNKSENIDEIIEIYSGRYSTSKELIEEFRIFIRDQLLKANEIPETLHDKMKYTQTQWKHFERLKQNYP